MHNNVADRDSIRECIYLSTRAIDRCDESLFRSAYWPEAMHTGVGLTLPMEQFIAMAVPALRGYDCLSHMVGNVLVKLAGDRAVSEAYVFAYHRYDDNGRKRDNIQSGRYLDRFERRDGVWKIIERTVVIDWFRDFDDSADLDLGPMGAPALMGSGPRADDPSHAHFASLD